MSNDSLIPNYCWQTQYEATQMQLTRPIDDEIINVYEVYIKEEISGSENKIDERNDLSCVLSLSNRNDDPLIDAAKICNNFSLQNGQHSQITFKDNRLDLDAIINSEIADEISNMNARILDKNVPEYSIIEPNLDDLKENLIFSQSMRDGKLSTGSQHIDKNDPRSRLHFVKYLKRDGKNLKIWECGICAKEFRHQYTLMRHLPTHTDERNFKCEACGKAFRQLSTLSQHKAIHSDARPYVCEFCKKTFNRVSTLISHRKTHSEHKPHKCHLCGKGFHQKGNLRNHVFTHTNERPYKCELCNKGFNQMSNLVCHKVKAHAFSGKAQYICGICGIEFSRKSALRSHEEIEHGIKCSDDIQIEFDDQNNVNHKKMKIVIDNDLNNKPSNSEDSNTSMVAISTPEDDMQIVDGPSENSKQELKESKAVQIHLPETDVMLQKEWEGKFKFPAEFYEPDNEQGAGDLLASLDSQIYADIVSQDMNRQLDRIPSSVEECNEFFELVNQRGLQLIRDADGGYYELTPNNESCEFITPDLFCSEKPDCTNADVNENTQNIDNQIMILNPNPLQKMVMLDDIQVLEDKEIRILGKKNSCDSFIDSLTMLSQSKIESNMSGPRIYPPEFIPIDDMKYDMSVGR